MRSTLLLAAFLASIATDTRAGDWPTLAGCSHRLFFNPAETQITPANVGSPWIAAGAMNDGP